MVIRIKAKVRTLCLFVIYDQNNPIEVFTERRVRFSLNKDDTTVFKINLSSEFSEVDIDF